MNTVEGVEELKVYLTLLEENPQYAAAILEANDDQSTNFKSSIGPLGYVYRSEDSTSLESPSLKVWKIKLYSIHVWQQYITIENKMKHISLRN